ncbi:HNH endonuclease [Candidatus Electronema sp. JC]|uniref:HNH endonuclease n=1 Tax=Candidatus Electronema sp. JC TaxID=3401570 RepID=UPI003B435AD9
MQQFDANTINAKRTRDDNKNYWWFGINNIKERNKSSCHVTYSEIEDFLNEKTEEFIWNYGGAAYSKKFYSQMCVGDKIILWMGHGRFEHWGILGFAYLSDILEEGSRFSIKLIGILKKPLSPYQKGTPHETENTIFLRDIFGLDFYALRDVFFQVKYVEKRTTPVTIDKVTREQYLALFKKVNIDISLHEDYFPDEIHANRDAKEIYEGAAKQIIVNAYERNSEARRICLEFYGTNCSVCNFNFKDGYGEIGENFIHVHHLKPLSEIGKEYELNPIQDLRPVCPNCHAMLHKRKPPYSIEELMKIISYTFRYKKIDESCTT